MNHTTETCVFCKKADVVPDYPLYRAGCRGCAIRALAHSPVFHAAGVSGRLSADDPYSKALASIFGDDWRKGHELVKAQAKRIHEGRAIL